MKFATAMMLMGAVSSHNLMKQPDEDQKLSILSFPEDVAPISRPLEITEAQNSTEEVEADPDFSKTFNQICDEHNFDHESHSVTTKDGYILNVFRVKAKTTKKGAPVVFLQHGITDSADCWIMNTVDKAPDFVLANAGYDVWLGNQRGTKYSLGHSTLSTKDKKYWEFSFTEMGEYDAPAQIERALAVAEVSKATYIGHS